MGELVGVKLVFIGNLLMGDDGVGIRLYQELKDRPELKNFECIELGALGLDLISYIEKTDKLILIDAVQKENVALGKVVILEEKDLSNDITVISQHDFGVEQTITILRNYQPGLKEVHIIGIGVKSIGRVSDHISPEMEKKLPEIKKQVLKSILKLACNSASNASNANKKSAKR